MGTPAEREFVGACSHLSGGNPFLFAELLRTARAEAIEPSAANSSRVRALTPAGVSHAVLVRLAQLAPDAHRLAGALAVLGDAGRLREAVLLAGLEPGDAAAAVDALIGAEVLARSQPLRIPPPARAQRRLRRPPGVGATGGASARSAPARRGARGRRRPGARRICSRSSRAATAGRPSACSRRACGRSTAVAATRRPPICGAPSKSLPRRASARACSFRSPRPRRQAARRRPSPT